MNKSAWFNTTCCDSEGIPSVTTKPMWSQGMNAVISNNNDK